MSTKITILSTAGLTQDQEWVCQVTGTISDSDNLYFHSWSSYTNSGATVIYSLFLIWIWDKSTVTGLFFYIIILINASLVYSSSQPPVSPYLYSFPPIRSHVTVKTQENAIWLCRHLRSSRDNTYAYDPSPEVLGGPGLQCCHPQLQVQEEASLGLMTVCL